MSYSSQGYSSQNGNPLSGKPSGGGYGGEDHSQSGKRRQEQQRASLVGVPSSTGFHQKDHYPGSHYSSFPGCQSSLNQTGEKQKPQGEELPQSGKSCHKKHQQPPQQQQASPVRVLRQENLAENNNPAEQQPPGVPINPKNNDLSNHQSLNQSLPNDSSSSTHQLSRESTRKIQQELRNPTESSVEDPPKNPIFTSFDLPVNNNGGKHHSKTNNESALQPMLAEINSKVDQKMNSSHGLKETLPVPDGYPPNRSPTSPSKLEPRTKKGLLEKICCCCF